MKDRRRARLQPNDKRELLVPNPQLRNADPTVSRHGHQRRHTPGTIVWNSPDPPDANESRRLYPPVDARIVAVKVSCDVAQAADSVWDLKIDGNSIFHTSTKPTLITGATDGNWYRPDRPGWRLGSYLTMINTSGLPTDKVSIVVVYEQAGR